MQVATIQSLAGEVSQAFEHAKRLDDTDFVKLKAGSPKWMTDLCRVAHGTMLPDDQRFAMIESACDALAESDDPDEASIEADIYTSALTAWLNSRVDRYTYCDEAMEEWGSDFKGMIHLLQIGQQREQDEVLGLVRDFLDNMANEQEILAMPDDSDD